MSDFTPGELAHIARYALALQQLSNEDEKFYANWRTFKRWDEGQRLWWIDIVEQQARDEKDTIGRHVVLRVVMNRLTEGEPNV